ncbi:dephospho-CoA kinase [Enterovibrio makurazakiensis]|uniref:Dephospho-CoA kinase n=1 Tax=Enterovibrio gelatinilyticus TaxID=2899819 RepID=A0ABT5QXG9_9GAMM|nr:dephospho-CoA kinase [Enterovibrio sp. ZSDZ42]MDD1791982.1 dephospho-CoA kinase [Enterovibrio sp. ZSDZ42]
MAFVIGVTGGIGSGKTTVANLFGDKGIDIVDADIIARQVVERGSDGLNAIAAKFGETMLDDTGELNRAALREHVFSHPEDKDWLNALLHPKIRHEMRTQTQQALSPYCLLVIPLLVENGLQALCDRVLVVDVPEHTQIERASRRDSVSNEQVKRILAAQATRDDRLALADDVIVNECTQDELSRQVDQLHLQYLTLAGQDTENHHE